MAHPYRQPWPWEPQPEAPASGPRKAHEGIRATLARVYDGDRPSGLRAHVTMADDGLTHDWRRGRDAIVDDCREVYGCDQAEAHNRATDIVRDQARRG